LIESGSKAFSICVNALSGTAPGTAELVAVFALETVLLAPTLDLMAFEGALSVIDEGVYLTEVVVALEPAEEEPEDA
jgi:hypothetical protein